MTRAMLDQAKYHGIYAVGSRAGRDDQQQHEGVQYFGQIKPIGDSVCLILRRLFALMVGLGLDDDSPPTPCTSRTAPISCRATTSELALKSMLTLLVCSR
jgi:hypothetical protein